MEKVAAWPIEGIEMTCPNPDCNRTFQELGADPRDTTGYYPDSEGQIMCPYCETEFEYYVEEY